MSSAFCCSTRSSSKLVVLNPDKSAFVMLQADAVKGERAKVTIADVIDRANGDSLLPLPGKIDP